MLPKKIIKFFRFGVPEVKKETHPESDEMIKLCRVKKEEANDSITNSNSTSEDLCLYLFQCQQSLITNNAGSITLYNANLKSTFNNV